MRDVKGLKVDRESGEGSVELPEWFHEMNSLWQLDVLGDWLGELQALYARAGASFRKQTAAVTPHCAETDTEIRNVMDRIAKDIGL